MATTNSQPGGGAACGRARQSVDRRWACLGKGCSNSNGGVEDASGGEQYEPCRGPPPAMWSHSSLPDHPHRTWLGTALAPLSTDDDRLPSFASWGVMRVQLRLRVPPASHIDVSGKGWALAVGGALGAPAAQIVAVEVAT
eukprot:CAMPEP_0174709766 /NCGR_PEP_ID=MMETSP1094-20130205/11618_1 /TAXON_ID=156173 /ORGANISM="Chrysochromulina brevifilum, Strain UTEX LB 985" /LENGTH=139 /DNA_ID=CAMNT_0015908477 /DNA_START=78 /DNA_END=495 /DNA_ORIENTATION=+